MRRLISVFDVCSLESILAELIACNGSLLLIISVVEHARLSLTWLHTFIGRFSRDCVHIRM